MRLDRDTLTLYAVTDRSWLSDRSLATDVEAAIRGGVTLVQLREKNLPEDEFLAEACEISALCKKHGVPFIINDNVGIAVRCGADGVHVGQSDTSPAEIRRLHGDSLIIGTTARTVEDAVAAEKNGADYLGVGALFPTSTKTDTHPVDAETLRMICAAVSIPVVAIGGINKHNMASLRGTGIAGAALVSAIFAARDIESECRELYRLAAGISS